MSYTCAHAYTRVHARRQAHIGTFKRSLALTCAHAIPRPHTCAHAGAHVHTHASTHAHTRIFRQHARTRVVNVLHCVCLSSVVCHNAFFCLLTPCFLVCSAIVQGEKGLVCVLPLQHGYGILQRGLGCDQGGVPALAIVLVSSCL